VKLVNILTICVRTSMRSSILVIVGKSLAAAEPRASLPKLGVLCLL